MKNVHLGDGEDDDRISRPVVGARLYLESADVDSVMVTASFDVASLTWMKVYDATSSWITSWLRRSLELKSVVVNMNHRNSKKAGGRTNQPAKNNLPCRSSGGKPHQK